jgi:hypothetical protein
MIVRRRSTYRGGRCPASSGLSVAFASISIRSRFAALHVDAA